MGRNDTLVESFSHNNRLVEIHVDVDPPSPREWDNLTTIAHWHRRYDLGEQMSEQIPDEGEMLAYLHEKGEEVLSIAPLYMLDHSGITISTKPFGCRWDSGLVGWVYVTKENAEKMGCVGDEWGEAKYQESIEGEIKTYDDFLTGRVYGYVIKGMEDDTLDSVWGFFGDIEDCKSDAKSATRYCDDPAVASEVENMRNRATFAGISES